MADNKKIRSGVWLAIKSVVVGSVVVSRVFAAPAPMAPSHDGLINDWRVLGNQMSGNQSSLPLLSNHLIDMIAAADLDNNLSDVVAASYEMVDQSQISALDAHWASVLTSAENPSLVAEFLNLRSAIDLSGAGGHQADDLVWLAQGRGGGRGCDNGFGNGDDGAPGGSRPNNGAENDEDEDDVGCNAGRGRGGSPSC